MGDKLSRHGLVKFVLCVNQVRPQNPATWANSSLDVAMKILFVDEINI